MAQTSEYLCYGGEDTCESNLLIHEYLTNAAGVLAGYYSLTQRGRVCRQVMLDEKCPRLSVVDVNEDSVRGPATETRLLIHGVVGSCVHPSDDSGIISLGISRHYRSERTERLDLGVRLSNIRGRAENVVSLTVAYGVETLPPEYQDDPFAFEETGTDEGTAYYGLRDPADLAFVLNAARCVVQGEVGVKDFYEQVVGHGRTLMLPQQRIPANLATHEQGGRVANGDKSFLAPNMV